MDDELKSRIHEEVLKAILVGIVTACISYAFDQYRSK